MYTYPYGPGGYAPSSAPTQQPSASQQPNYGQAGAFGATGYSAPPPVGPGGPGYPGGHYGPPPEEGQKHKNIPGIIALVCAIIGFVFAVIPGAMLVGWVLLPIAFILSLVSLFQKNKGKGSGIAALIISVVGTLVGVIVFVSLLGSAVGESFGSDDFDVSTPGTADSAPATEPADGTGTQGADASAPSGEDAGGGDAQSAEGTRENPLPVGTTITQGEWEVTVNSVNLDATQEVLAANGFNDKPAEGEVYILVNITMKYLGDSPDGELPMPSVAYVTADGHTRESYDNFIVGPDPFSDANTLYHGAKATGNVALAAPKKTVEKGTIALEPDVWDNKIYFAVK